MKSLFTTLLLVLFVSTGNLLAQSTDYKMLDKSSMKIEGTSTIHDWHAEVEEINTDIAITEDSTGSVVDSFSMTIPVKSIESGKGGMNSKIYDALKEKKHPEIMFELKSTEAAQDSDSLNVSGTLTIAGSSRDITLPVLSSKASDGSYKFAGSYEINMKDYEVDPPSAMFGTIKSGEKVTVSFELYFQ